MLLLGGFIVLKGSWSRVVVARTISTTFGSRPEAFLHKLPIDLNVLQIIIDEKKNLLETLEPSASEALFSPTFRHWIRHPCQTWRYMILSKREQSIVTAHGQLRLVQKYWRVVHVTAAYLFLAGMFIHIVLVIFLLVMFRVVKKFTGGILQYGILTLCPFWIRCSNGRIR